MKKTMTIAMLILIVSACTKPTPEANPPAPSKGKWCYTCWELDASYVKILSTQDSFCDSAKYEMYSSNKTKPLHTCRKD